VSEVEQLAALAAIHRLLEEHGNVSAKTAGIIRAR